MNIGKVSKIPYVKLSREISDKKKIDRLSKESPRMYYTPEEFPIPNETNTVQLYFYNSSLIFPVINEYKQDSQITVYKKVYQKIRLRNTIYDYVLVDVDQMDIFNEMYLGKKSEQNKKEKTWI